jgi:hypothetical protein
VRAGLIVACVLSVSPAHAACHLYSHWAYPFPQRCGNMRLAESKPIPESQTPPLPEFDPRWTIKDGNLEVVRTPGMTDEEGRAIAIEALKTVMGK